MGGLPKSAFPLPALDGALERIKATKPSLPESLWPVVDLMESVMDELYHPTEDIGGEAIHRLRGAVTIWRAGCASLQQEYSALQAQCLTLQGRIAQLELQLRAGG